MKKITILLASAGLLLGLPSCDEWLTATSSTQISDTQLFSSRNGFQEALSGIYLCMAQPECYGRDYTWFVSDLTAFPYAAQHSNNYISLQNHNYTNAISFPVRNWMPGVTWSRTRPNTGFSEENSSACGPGSISISSGCGGAKTGTGRTRAR